MAAKLQATVDENWIEQPRQSPPAAPMIHPRVTRFAQNVSHVISPPVVGGLLAWSVARATTPTSRDALHWVMPYWFMLCIAPVAFIGLLMARGKITDIHVGLREQRTQPMLIALLCTLTAWLLFHVWQAPELMQRLVLLNLVQMAILAVVTLIWQISFHGAAVGAAVTVGYSLFGPVAALAVAPAALAGWSRVYLRRHTLGQVIAGAMVGVGVAMLVMAS